MSDSFTPAQYLPVIVVERTGEPGEFWYDGRPLPFEGFAELSLPRFMAEFLFRSNQQKVWTTDNQYVCRFGVKPGQQGVDDFIYAIGKECTDMTPLTRNTARVTGAVGTSSDLVAQRVEMSGDEILSMRQNLSAGAPVYVKG